MRIVYQLLFLLGCISTTISISFALQENYLFAAVTAFSGSVLVLASLVIQQVHTIKILNRNKEEVDKVGELYEKAEEIYQQQDDGRCFYYQVIKSRLFDEGTKVDRKVIDKNISSKAPTLVLDIYGGILGKNF
ncbi:hypothetical protein [Paenibacillus lactis]|uniref:hypothetical protein n=1 Tax=Paenibacillus lactis TaxID=228574 RepID=UPI003D707F3F